MKKVMSILLATTVAVFFAAFALAQEEHPEKKEHPKSEHPAKKVTIADIDKSITTAIQDQAKADGMFHVKDAVLDKTWDLTLVKVHKDKLTALDDSNYFACVDFKAKDGTMADVDFFLKSQDGKLKVTDTSVHKVNGVARYAYQEKNGFWVRVENPKSTE
ncbi:hypothetical protein L0222_07755 [bacterium]|nr:hypothetical protein [bacterium]MCI0603689.1 hypothetical protein [bacterium]